ncbi:hypothetical protein D0869_00619 [Hortaea werneckii]|uniref:Major facilitator superfamily (MFS) profile domain-containing protein n=1 Tax=Hortaea werneckii TaxID=91943 RepID=A0A3M6XGU9_HORWE|nr:hypothetical protein D0869_00619 [Hortaea werneckii]
MVERRPAFLQPKPQRSKEERDLVLRLDIFLMTLGCISQVIKYLDQQNINNAYVSGMEEDLHLDGNELNYFTTYFNVAYCIMLVPSHIITTWVRPSLWLPGLEICWGILTGLMATITEAKQAYAIRAFPGLCESSAWPGMMTLFMHWYTPTELAKRMGFYHSCQAVGSMMSGALQAAITDTMSGYGGLTGWRWLFVINAIITVVWGLLGFVMLPDYPNKPNPRTFWFTKTHDEMAMERLVRYKRAEPKRVTFAAFKRTFSGWTVYFIAVLYIATVLASYGYVYFSLFLKAQMNPDGSRVWSTEEVNVIPIGDSAINVVFVWIWALLSDFLRTRWTLIVTQAVIGLVPCIYEAWLSEIAVAGYYAISAWSQVLVWLASQAPYCRSHLLLSRYEAMLTLRIDNYGWQTSIALWVLVIGMTCTLRVIDINYLLLHPNIEANILRRPKRRATDHVESEHAPAKTIEPSSEAVSNSPAKKAAVSVASSRYDSWNLHND